MNNKRLAIVSAMLLLTTLYGCAGPVIFAGGAAAGTAAVDRRTTGTMVEDQSIELKISNEIYSDQDMKKQIHVNVTSFNGIVLLTGETPTEAMRNKVIDLARHVDKVRKIHNEIIIAPKSSIKSRSQDTWITTKVKSSLINTKELNALSIKVVTENQIVYLMGIVNRKEAKIATNVTRGVTGIKQIVKLFEYP